MVQVPRLLCYKSRACIHERMLSSHVSEGSGVRLIGLALFRQMSFGGIDVICVPAWLWLHTTFRVGEPGPCQENRGIISSKPIPGLSVNTNLVVSTIPKN